MSDYRPPNAEKNINDMPEECIRLIFIPLSMLDLMNAGRVCKLWNTLQKSVCLTKKSLVILIGEKTTFNWMHPQRNKECSLENVLDDDGKPMAVDTMERDFKNNGFKTKKLHMSKVSLLETTFANVTEITVGCRHSSQLLLDGVLRLLTKFGPQLVTLKLTLNYLLQNHKGLYDAINNLTMLKHLHLKFFSGLKYRRYKHVSIVPLTILGQLEQFHFHKIGPSPLIAQHWTPHLESRAEPLRIAYTGRLFDQEDLHSITPKTAAMFTNVPALNFFALPEMNRFMSKFCNLVEFSLTTNLPLPELLNGLANLKNLALLSIWANYYPNFNNDAHQVLILPQLPSVKLFFLQQSLSSHADLTRWNLGWTMPNLELLYIENLLYNDNDKCADCNNDRSDCEQIKQCYFLQMRSLKQQCTQLRAAEFTSNQIKCRLAEITD